MAAIITDQLRILNAANFRAGIATTTSNYYTWVGLPNPADLESNWDSDPPSPKDSFDDENYYWDTIISLKKINSDDIRRVVSKNTWTSGTKYDMYRHDYSRSNISPVSGATNLYSANYYVINRDYRVYICLKNGMDPDNTSGRPSLDEPLFTDLEPRSAGTSGDGYIWKYLYTLTPSEIIRFDSTNFIPVPEDWETNSAVASVRDNSKTSGQLKVITITNAGTGYGTATSYSNVDILGDGRDAKATVTVTPDGKIGSIDVSSGGEGYSYGTVDLEGSGITNSTSSTDAVFNVIIPPQGGHGADIYRELGATRTMIYSRLENDVTNPDFITGNHFARVGIVKDPEVYGSVKTSPTYLTANRASGVGALKVTSPILSSIVFQPDAVITQTVGLGSTAIGRVISWDSTTGVLKYWQDRQVSTSSTTGVSPQFGFERLEFKNTLTDPSNSSFNITGGNAVVAIDTNFSGVSTTLNNKTYFLGLTFDEGIASPEVKKQSGEIIFADNRPSVLRSENQKEDIKIVLEF
jgi:hypothetical protein